MYGHCDRCGCSEAKQADSRRRGGSSAEVSAGAGQRAAGTDVRGAAQPTVELWIVQLVRPRGLEPLASCSGGLFRSRIASYRKPTLYRRISA